LTPDLTKLGLDDEGITVRILKPNLFWAQKEVSKLVLKIMCDEIEITELEVLEASGFLKDEDGNAVNYGFIVLPPYLAPEDKMPLSKDDAEQVSAASNLLEFHNQQVLVPTHTVRDSLPPFQLVDMKVNLFRGRTAAKSEAPEFAPKLIRPVIRGYGKKPITTVKVEENNLIISKQKVPIVQSSSSTKLVPKKKRRLLIDTLKAIPNAEFKRQLNCTEDIVIDGDLAPATKKAMHQLTYCGVGKFFAYPGRKILSGPLSQIFFSHLTVRTEPVSVQNGELEPLSPDLRTDTNFMQSFSCTLQPHSQPSSEFSETLARRTANSFDQYIKGFTNQKCRRTKNLKDSPKKQSMVAEYSAAILQPSEEVLIKGMEGSPMPSPGTELITSDPLHLQPGSPMSLETGTPLEMETESPSETENTLESATSEYSMTMVEVDKDHEDLLANENEIYFINGNNEVFIIMNEPKLTS